MGGTDYAFPASSSKGKVYFLWREAKNKFQILSVLQYLSMDILQPFCKFDSKRISRILAYIESTVESKASMYSMK